MEYLFDHYDVDGDIILNRELTLTLDVDKNVVAYYREVNGTVTVVIKIKNDGAADFSFVKTDKAKTVVPPGGEVQVVIDPEKEMIVAV